MNVSKLTIFQEDKKIISYRIGDGDDHTHLEFTDSVLLADREDNMFEADNIAYILRIVHNAGLRGEKLTIILDEEHNEDNDKN